MLDFTRTMAPEPDLWMFGLDASLMAKVDFDASASELLGKEIGPYTLVRRLGMGGMAETFVAIRRGPSGFSQRVCLKLVLSEFRDDKEFVRLFQREAAWLAIEIAKGLDLLLGGFSQCGRR